MPDFPTPSQPPAARFACIVATLCALMAARLGRPGKPGLAGPLILAVANRLNRMAQRITRLAVRVAAGTLRPPRRRPAAPRRAATAGTLPERVKLPRRRMWLVRLVPEAAVGANYLQILLDDPEMVALIQAAPQIGRTLRPLWHMLSPDPLPKILQRPRPATVPSPKLRLAEAHRAPPAGPPRPDPSRRPRRLPPAPEVAAPACGPPLPA